MLGVRLLTASVWRVSPSETALLGLLRETCGPGFVSQYERMLGDMEQSLQLGTQHRAGASGTRRRKAPSSHHDATFTVITGGTWNMRGKLLPGHALLQMTGDAFVWPGGDIAGFEHFYGLTFPKRRLTWIPALSAVEGEMLVDDGPRVPMRTSSVQAAVLEALKTDAWMDADALGVAVFGRSAPVSDALLAPLLHAGLVSQRRAGGSNEYRFAPNGARIRDALAASPDGILDLFGASLGTLADSGSSGSGAVSVSNSSFLAGGSGTASATGWGTHVHSHPLSRSDRSILLQCVSMRLLKQLRSLALADLYSRLSMLPLLLSRFSPPMDEVIEALRQLHDKEFVRLCLGDQDNEREMTQDDLTALAVDPVHQDVFVKYLA